ncbi:ESPR-type extended signal peptide-containing protein [Acinetobacter nosocomialis]|uniref:ESPR-type extended signal peptide-containing protein n=1 Tax=Acinetobacter nosocomialis TaxID=106654 RepID=UPI00274040D7|nr:ESPR-type extended signal peptide-containing protein [Acinetobacter nosocomialis]MDP7776566.1 ESPR-type extended signal peptide-containing protein [Acinetobacter nosocomialis]
MNKIYKVIWNASLGIWVAVSEIAKGHSKTRSQRINNALMPSTEATDFLQSSTSINFKIKPLTWGILTVLVPSITFGEVGVSGGFATGNNATAISACTGTGVGGTGDRATAGGERALAIGCGAVTDSDRDIAIGSQASTVNPANATGTYNESIAIGAESRASGSQALAIGGQATATGNSSVAIGADDMDKVASTNPPAYNYTPTAGDNALYNNTATAAAYKNLTGDYLVDFEKTNDGASGVGNRYTRVQTGEAAVAIGPKSTATDLGTALGPVATAGSIASVAVGVKAEARGQGSLSIGSLAYTANTGDVAVGINSAATGGDSIAIGAGSDLKGTAYVQSGASASKKGASASGANSISIGTNTAATGTNAVVVGTQSTASNLAVAVGSVATAGDQSVSIGSNSAASSQTSVAIGVRAQTLQTNSVALGSDSVADRASGSLGYDPLTETSTTNTNSTWKATDAAVSVGNGTTRTRQITSVAAGTNDTDAANVAQLKKATSKVLAGTGTTVAQGTDSNGITTYTVNANTFTVRQGTTNKATIGDSTTDKVSFINGKNTVAKVADELNSNTDVTFDLADDISLNSVTTGNTTLNSSGVTVNGGANGPVKLTNTGLDNGGNKITNVAAGTISATSTDAVNGSQLNTTNQNVTTAQNTANTAVTNAAAAQATADKGLNFSVNGGTADNVKLGETVNFADGINTTAVYDPATNTYKYNVNDNIALTNAGSLTVGNSKVDNSGLTITGGPSITTAGINAGNQKITNVAAGTISASSTDAVNGSQLNMTNQNVTTAQNTANTAVTNAAAAQATADKGLNFSVNGGTADNVKLGETVNFADGTNTTAVYDPATNTYKYNVNDNIALTNAGSLTVGNSKVDNSGLTITGGPSVTTAGINAGNKKITNVAAGTISSTSTDAVNGSQLNTTNQNVTNAQNTANTAVTNAAAAQATAEKGLNFSVNGGTADNVKLGETVNFADGINTTAVYDPATNTYKYNVNDNIALTNAGSLTVGNTKVDNSGLTITGGPSVTTAGINAGNQKITNVAAGTISATSTDAVNGSQLNTTNQNVTTAQNTANTAVTNAAAAQATADKGLNFSVNGGTADNVKLGETINFADGINTTAVYDPATNTYKYNVNDNITLTNAGSLTVGNSKVDNNGLTITGGPSVTTAGINAGNQKITNVAAGTNATDAVNVSQLGAITTAANTKTDALGISTASNLGGGAVYNPVTGAVSSPIYSVNGTNVNNVGDAITALDKGWTLQSNGANAGAVKAGDTVDIGTVAGESNLKVTKTGNKIQYGLNRDLNIDSVMAGDSKLDTTGLTITGGPSVTTAGINAGNQKITNVAVGTISATSTDAVNGSQLDATNQNVTTAQNTANTAVINAAAAQATADKGLNFSVNGGTADNVKLGETVNFADGTNITAVYDPATNTYKYNVNDSIALTNVGSLTVGNTKVDNSGLTITGGPSVTTAGINAGNQKITNVAAGTNATDAVNVSQLGAVTTAANTKTDALGTSTASNLGGGAVYNPVTGAVSSPIYSVNGNNVNNVGDAITALDKGWTLQSNGANAGAVKAGDTVDIGTVAGESNLKVTKTGNKIQYGLNRDLNIDNVTAGESKLDTNGLTIAGGPSVTKSGIDAASQKITNVAAGTVSATSTDAVNGSQLHTLDSRVTKNGDSIANIFGGGAKANPDGSISNPSYKVTGTSANNVGDALTALDKAVTDAGTAANTGWTVLANGDAATAKKIKPNGKVNFTGDDNLTVAQTSETDNEGNIKVALNKNLKVDSVTTGNTVIDTTGVKVGDNIQLGSTGLIIAGGPSMTTSGINAGNKVITNVAAGVNTTDAVNKGQLDSAITNINNNVGALANSAVQYDKNADGTVNKDSVTFAGGANGTALKNVADGTVAAGSKDAVNGGQLWTVQQQVDKNTGDISNLQTDISNINNGKSGLVQQANKDAAITVGKDTGGTQVNVAGTAGDRTVTGVKAGAVTATSKDAVNGSQLNTTNQALVNYLGGGAGYDNITQSFSNPTYNVGDKSYNNVGDAIGALNQADQTLNTKIDSVTNKLEQAFYSTNQRIDKLEEKMSAGIAANAALENAPFIPGKVTMAVGAAYYNEQNAVGVTLRKTADNGRWSLTTGASLGSQGSPLVRVGVSTVID